MATAMLESQPEIGVGNWLNPGLENGVQPDQPHDDGNNWICPWCGNENFPNRKVCNRRTCSLPKPMDNLPLPSEEGNWICPACGNENFPQRTQCNKRICGLPKPEPPLTENWICPACSNENFPNRFTCNRRSCGLPRSAAGRRQHRDSRVEDKEQMQSGTKWECPSCGNENYPHRMVCNRRNCGLPKPGEKDANNWMCPYCNNENYPTRLVCNSRSCKQPKPGSQPSNALSHPVTSNGGNPLTSTRRDSNLPNWLCPSCGNDNYGTRDVCNKNDCRRPRPSMVNFAGAKPQSNQNTRGDNWTCPKCNNVNYAQREVCNMRNCDVRRPVAQARSNHRDSGGGGRADDWQCPLCGNTNYGHRTECNMRSCGAPRPSETNVNVASGGGFSLSSGNLLNGNDGNTLRGGQQQQLMGNNTAISNLDPLSWACPKCGNLNFATRAECNMRNCKAPRPDNIVPGDDTRGRKRRREIRDDGDNWLCPECGNSNFPNRVVCNMKKCGAPRPDIGDDKRQKTESGGNVETFGFPIPQH